MSTTYYSVSTCPPGLDCVGAQVVVPIQSIQPIPCNDGFAGFHCGSGYDLTLCESGYFCETPATQQICPDGYYCPNGATSPIKCNPLSLCAAGTFQYRWLLLLIVVLLVIFALTMGKLYHNRLLTTRAKQKKKDIEKVAAEQSKTRSQQISNQESETQSREVSVSMKQHDDGTAVTTQGRRGSMASVPGVTLSFEHVHVAVKLADGKDKIILHDVNGRFQASKLSAIMGPSGSGKTTFLNALTGRIPSTGTIKINEQHTVHEIKPLSGFVPQADTMYPMLTVRDVLTHSAMTRLPADWTQQQKLQRVERVVDVLGLRRVIDSVIGDEHTRGVSGGEKKRVSIGMELVADPLVLYLDEPTSGLDASSAKDVVAALQRVAQLGTTVITVIHQPRYDIFSMFDDVLFLAKGGHTVYFGPVSQCESHFANLGHVQTEIGNPADFYMDIIHKHYANHGLTSSNTGSLTIQVTAKQEIPIPSQQQSPPEQRGSSESNTVEMTPVVIHHEQEFKQEDIMVDKISSAIATEKSIDVIVPKLMESQPHRSTPSPPLSISSHLLSHHPVGFFHQFLLYLKLSFLLDFRYVKPIVTDTILQFLPGLALGLPSMGEEMYAPPLPESIALFCPEIIRDRCLTKAINGDGAIISTFFTTMVLGATACIFSVTTFGRNMHIFEREQSTGNNTTTSYWLARCCYDLLHITRNCLIFLSLFMLSASPHSTFGRWFITIWLLQFAAYGLGYFVSTLVRFERATVIAVVIAISISVTSGLTPSLDVVKNWNILQIFWYLSYNRWSSEAMIVMNTDIASSPSESARIAATIRDTGYSVDHFTLDQGVVLAIGIGYRVLTWGMLQYRVRYKKTV